MSHELKQVEAALAHDLNNFLQVVMGNLELLRRRREFVPEIVEAALAATRNAAQLADRVLALGRLQAPEPRVLDVNRLLGELREMLERSLGPTVRVETELAPDLRSVVADPRALQLALLELVANARHALPGGGRVTLRTANAPQNLVLVEFADTGSGMSREVIDKALQPPLPGAVSGQRGLGLHIVDLCLQQSGGRLEVDSTPGAGTRVKLYLPAK